jgi:hypothetical protein
MYVSLEGFCQALRTFILRKNIKRAFIEHPTVKDSQFPAVTASKKNLDSARLQ